MPRIRIEGVPVQVFGLGHFGFDHLQLVYQQNEADFHGAQDHWFVMEGVREATGEGAILGIEGADGRTTLAVANLAAREELIAKIGTPDYRGSHSLPYDGDAFRAWETMASYARDIEQQDFPYIPYGLPGSPTPTVNSSSVIASLIYYSGLDPSRQLPFGVHFSPGTATLLGTSGDDVLRIEQGFTTLLGGRGDDEFVGGFDRHRIEKFYGGEGHDLFHWSSGFNIVHGGQPQLSYESDGTDVMDYSGAGTVTITLNRHWIPHKVPRYVAVFENGLDYLFSIERIQWNETTDRIVLGKGIDLVEDDSILQWGARSNGHGDQSDPSHLRSGYLIDEDDVGAPVRAAVDYTLPDHGRDLELKDLQGFAAAAPLLEYIPTEPIDDRLVFRPQFSSEPTSAAGESDGGQSVFAGVVVDGIAAAADMHFGTGGDDPTGAAIAPLTGAAPSIDEHGNWLF